MNVHLRILNSLACYIFESSNCIRMVEMSKDCVKEKHEENRAFDCVLECKEYALCVCLLAFMCNLARCSI